MWIWVNFHEAFLFYSSGALSVVVPFMAMRINFQSERSEFISQPATKSLEKTKSVAVSNRRQMKPIHRFIFSRYQGNLISNNFPATRPWKLKPIQTRYSIRSCFGSLASFSQRRKIVLLSIQRVLALICLFSNLLFD